MDVTQPRAGCQRVYRRGVEETHFSRRLHKRTRGRSVRPVTRCSIRSAVRNENAAPEPARAANRRVTKGRPCQPGGIVGFAPTPDGAAAPGVVEGRSGTAPASISRESGVSGGLSGPQACMEAPSTPTNASTRHEKVFAVIFELPFAKPSDPTLRARGRRLAEPFV